MASLTNIRLHTITKVVPDEGDFTLASVMVDNGTLLVRYTDGPYYILGSLSNDDYTIPTPLELQCPCGENTSNSNVLATLLKGVDGITPDMSDYYDKAEIDKKLAEKQAVISDLDTIRSNASKGVTALQSVPSEYVTESELQNKGYLTTIPREYVTEDELLSKDYATVSQVNTKQDNISDLDAIRSGAAKGATALQVEEYRGTVTAVKVNGETKSPSDGVVDLGEINGGSADLTGYATEEYVNNAVAEANVKGEDGYVYSNGEKVDMRIRRSLIPIGTLIPAKANLNTIAYLKVGNYYCSQTANAKTITNCPVEVAFSMEVFNPLSENLDDETTAQYTYRIRKITVYNTGVQYIQYCNTSGTAGTWTYGSWYVMPRTSFSLASDKNGGSAVKGGSTRGVYIDASGTFQQMGYTIAKSVPSNAVFTDTNTKVTSVDNHYTPVEDADAAINAPEGEVVVGLKRDAAGHVVGIETIQYAGGGGGGITVLRIGDADDEAKANFIAVANGEKSADYYICSSGVQGASADGIVTNIEKTGPTGSPVYVSYTFYGSPMAGTLAKKLLKITTTLTVSTGVITTTYEAVLDAKQDAITDLEDIREGAAKGTTAVQPEDIKDEVYIADFTMESLLMGMNNSSQVGCNMQALVAAMNANKIILVREGADSEYKGVYVLNGYAEDMLYFSIVDSQGCILYCEGTDYVNYGQFIDGGTLRVRRWTDKQDTLVSGENIKTINGKSIIGSGDIAPSGYERKVVYTAGQTCGLSVDNKLMLTNILSGQLTIQLPTTNPTSDNYAKECGITFTTGSTAPTIIFNGNIWWVNGTAPIIDANSAYEFSFKFNFANNMWLGVYGSFKTA